MEVKVSELTRDALDWAVAKAEGWTWHTGISNWFGDQPWLERQDSKGTTRMQLWNLAYSTDWAVGGLILEAHPINLIQHTLAYRLENGDEGTQHLGWAAYMTPRHYWSTRIVFKGETKLVAIMRCYVASKFGDTLEIPDELITTPE